MKSFVLRGNLCDCSSVDAVRIRERAWLVCEDGLCSGVFDVLPERYRNLPVTDFGDALILPGLADLHVHAPQFSFRGLGMDMELLDWLERYTFPEESKYADAEYAARAYSQFVDALRRSFTTRVVAFGTIHRGATELLMRLLDESGLAAYVGKVNMDRNCPETLREDTAASLETTEAWVCETRERFANVKPILTPRFAPSCTPELLDGLGRLARKYALPVQSHLSENFGEIAWVKELFPNSGFYGEVYDRFGLFGGDTPCIMAHCVHSGEAERALMRSNGVFVAHSPLSNSNLASGAAPVSAYLAEGLHVGISSDVAGGETENLFAALAGAIRASKLRWRLYDESVRPLTVDQALYMATRGGGAFFGKVGAFEPGYELDAIVLDDTALVHPQPLSVRSRLERCLYLADDRQLAAKYVRGLRLF